MKKLVIFFILIFVAVNLYACGGITNNNVEDSTQIQDQTNDDEQKNDNEQEIDIVPGDEHPYIGTKSADLSYISKATDIIIDGQKDAFYYDGTIITIDEPNLNYFRKGPKVSSAIAYIVSDYDFINIYIEVVDSNIDYSNKTVWEKDSVGILLDFNYYREKETFGSDTQELMNNIGYINIAVDGTFELYNAYLETEYSDKIETDTMETDNGYSIEMKLPIINNFTGNKIGFEPLIIDAYYGCRQGVYTWDIDGSEMWHYTHVAGTLILKD